MNFDFERLAISLKYNLIRFSKNKKIAKRYKSIEYKKIIAKKIRTVKWGCSYSVYDGLELLEHSIKSIRKSCDYINVVYSDLSWYGKKSDENILALLEQLKEQGLIDEIIYYEPNLKLPAGKNEIIKRNLGLKHAKKAGVDYFMTVDADEFYLSNEIEKAKRFIVENKITHSFCNIVNYSILPTHRLFKTSSYIQFFSKLKATSKLTKNRNIITLVDPTRQLSHYFCAKYYFLSQVEMHHMTLIRKNLSDKFQNSSAKSFYKEKDFVVNSLQEYLKNTIEVPDLFNLQDLALSFVKGCKQ